MAKEFRKHYFLDEWVIYSEERANRPTDFRKERWKTKKGKKARQKNCPFCLGNEGMTPPEKLAVIDGKKWKHRVFENKFSALDQELEHREQGKNFYSHSPAFGLHEIIVETNNHSRLLKELSQKEMLELLKVYREREKALWKMKGIKRVVLFKNHGKECGASLSHEHSQIVGVPFVPPAARKEEEGAKKFYSKEGKCVYCEIEKKERKSERKVFENPSFTVIAPYASFWPHETWVVSKRHKRCLMEFTEKELRHLAGIYLQTLNAYFGLFGDLPYNAVFHSWNEKEKHVHFYIEFLPNIHKIYGGMEKGTGMALNEKFPENSACELMKAGKKKFLGKNL